MLRSSVFALARAGVDGSRDRLTGYGDNDAFLATVGSLLAALSAIERNVAAFFR